MSVLAIHTFPDPLLKMPAHPVERVTPQTSRLVHDLIDTMHYHPRCVGLAACQVGSSARVAVVDVTGHPKAVGSSGLLVLINPHIMAQEEWLAQREGCLSVPDLTGNVRRASRIQLKALDGEGNSWTRWVEGFEAVAVQHEVDHLDGTLFLDRITNVRTELFRRKQYWFPQSA